MRSESAWQLGPLPFPPWGPSHTLGLSSELYIPPSWTGAPAESPSIHSLCSPALAQTPCLVRRDEDKPASGPQQALYSHRTGTVGAGRVINTVERPPAPCPEPDPPGAGAQAEGGAAGMRGAGGRLCTAHKGHSAMGTRCARRQENWVVGPALLLTTREILAETRPLSFSLHLQAEVIIPPSKRLTR